jgi:predicted DNA-binding protein YlxM (UPF0122 family)
MERKKIFEQLYNDGKTYQEIGEMYSLSRQRVHQIIKGYKTKSRSAKYLGIKKRRLTKEKIMWILSDKVIKNERRRPVSKFLSNIAQSTGIISGSRERSREIVRLRDNHTCQWCGKKWIAGRKFDIHHIFGEPSDTKKVDWDMDVQITLCHKCHLNIDAWKMVKSRGVDKLLEE